MVRTALYITNPMGMRMEVIIWDFVHQKFLLCSCDRSRTCLNRNWIVLLIIQRCYNLNSTHFSHAVLMLGFVTMVIKKLKYLVTNIPFNNNSNFTKDSLSILQTQLYNTRAQETVNHSVAHYTYTESVFEHDQHWQEQKTLKAPQLQHHSPIIINVGIQ